MLSRILVIVGPTASGKTQLAINLAKRYKGEVLCVDSRTVYRGMDIGTAKVKDRQGIAHWGLDFVDPDEKYSIAEFKAYAEKKIAEILARGHLPILVGGTRLWIDAIVDNLDLPSVPPNSELRAEFETLSLDDLQKRLLDLDPDGGNVVDIKNKRRVIRALEVLATTRKTLAVMRQKGQPKYEATKIGIDVPIKELERKINARVEEMFKNGLIEEVERLRALYGADAPALSGIGYRHTNLDAIKKETRHLAKRQTTWFKRDPRIIWTDGRVESVTPFLDPHFLQSPS